METNARVPQHFFVDGLFGAANSDARLSVPQEVIKSVDVGAYTINWFYQRHMTINHMSILLTLLTQMKKQEVYDDLPLQLIEVPKNSEQTLEAVVALWDSLQRQVGVWAGSIRQLLIESKLDPNNPDNYRVARELLFNQKADGSDAGLDIKVNIVGGGIKCCRPVSLFKSSVGTEDKIIVLINWFFTASTFTDFRMLEQAESRVLKYSQLNIDGYYSMQTKGGWLVRACYIWLSHLTNGFTRELSIEWLKFESLVYGYKRDRTKRQRYDHLRQLKSAIIDILVNFPRHYLDGQIMTVAETDKIAYQIKDAEHLKLPVFKLKPIQTNLPAPAAHFDKFWEMWPKTERKLYRNYCLKLWQQLGLDDPAMADKVITAVRKRRQSNDWMVNPEKFIPAPANWLKKRGWE